MTGDFTFEILMNLVNAFIYIFFLEKYLKLKRGNYMVYLLVATVGYSIAFISLNAFFYYEGILGMCIYVILLFAIAIILMEGSWREKMYYSLLINSINCMMALAVSKLMALISSNSLIWVYSGVGTKRMIVVVSVQIFSALVLAIIYKIRTKFDERLSETEQNMSLVLLLLTCVVVIALNEIEIYSTGNMGVEKLMVFVILATLLVNMIVYYMLFRVNKLNYMNLRSQRLKQEIQAYENNTKEIYQKYEEFRKMKHDMANSYAMMHGLLQNGKSRELEDYLKIKSNLIRSSATLIYTGHAYVDSLLNTKFTEIQNNHVKLTYEVGSARCLNIEELDFCSILGNLLDNALEAVIKVEEDSRRINVNIRLDENKIMIVVRNTVNNISNMVGHVLETSKEESECHGMGTKIIKELAEKYRGGFSWSVNDNEFQANVLLFINRIEVG